MNGYVETGYVVILASLGTYATALVSRERAAKRRLGGASVTPSPPAARPAVTDVSSSPANGPSGSRGAEEEGPA